MPGHPAATSACDVIAEIDLSLTEHRSQSATRELINEAALVVALTDRHRDMMRQFFTYDADKIVSFNDLTSKGNVMDPIGGDIEAFRTTRDLLRKEMPQIIAAFRARVSSQSQKFGDQGPLH